MCGICGLVDRIEGEDRTPVFKMQDALTHRGPDDAGHFVGSRVSLAVRRLSIIDLVGGAQPLTNENGSITLVANGEIYNYVEKRRQLEDQGHRFRTASDCETIVHLYEEFGVDCVDHLRGMFAFAIWDDDRKRLMLARDRMGEKPLYLWRGGERFAFSSELGSLLSSGLVPFELEPDAINLYFHYSYVPEPLTPVRGIRKLPAGTVLLVEPKDWTFNEHQYWRMTDAVPLHDLPRGVIREGLDEVSEIITRSDVPVGVALSGGLDSSAIAASIASRYPGQLQAFSVGYSGTAPSDERRDANALALHLDIPFHHVEVSVADVVNGFPLLVREQDDPIADIAGSSYRALARLTADHGVKVLLQGQGGDELFWGYQWVRRAVVESARKLELKGSPRARDFWRYVQLTLPQRLHPGSIKHWLINLAGLREGFGRYNRDRRSGAEQLVFWDLTPDFKHAEKSISTYYAPNFSSRLTGPFPRSLFQRFGEESSLEVHLTELICSTYLLSNGIAQGDRLTMARSVELRLPLVDYRLVERVIGLRKRHSDSGSAKLWLRDAVEDRLPEWVLNRPKRGFAPPADEWHSALFSSYGGQLLDGYLVQNGVLSREGAEHLSYGTRPWGSVASVSYKALVLEQWCRTFCDLGRSSLCGELDQSRMHETPVNHDS